MTIDFWEWIEQKDLIKYVEQVAPVAEKILKECLNVQDELITIISDKGIKEKPIAPIFAGAYCIAAKKLDIPHKLVLQESKFKGESADCDVVEVLRRFPHNNIVIACVSGEVGKINPLAAGIRQFARESNHRFISTTNLSNLNISQLSKVISSMDIDYNKLHLRGMQIKEALDKADKVKIITEAGTDMIFGISRNSAILNTGHYFKPKSGGNIPCGEVYLAPNLFEIDGNVVIDGSSMNHAGTTLVNEPIKLKIKKGRVKSIEGGREAELLKFTIEQAKKKNIIADMIGELGIGINPAADIIGATIVDEKTLGTAHIALGSNHWFGGSIYSPVHLDQVFRNAKIYIDGSLFELDGKH